MKPFAAMPAAVVKNVRGVFCDIDDTLTSEGKLTARVRVGRAVMWHSHYAKGSSPKSFSIRSARFRITSSEALAFSPPRMLGPGRPLA